MKDGGLPWYLIWQRIYLKCRRPQFISWIRKIPQEKGETTHFSVLYFCSFILFMGFSRQEY